MDQLTFTEYHSDPITRINVGKVRLCKTTDVFKRYISRGPIFDFSPLTTLWLCSG